MKMMQCIFRKIDEIIQCIFRKLYEDDAMNI